MADQVTSQFRSFEESARAAGHRLWLETRLFEVLGAWSEVEQDPVVKLLLSTHSFRHAWHAEVWRRRLPVVGAPKPGWRPEVLSVPPSPRWAELMDAVAAPRRPEDAIERLVGMYRVLGPRLVASYREHLETADPISEGPTMRWLPLLVADEVDALTHGEGVLEVLLGGCEPPGPAAADRAAAHQSALEKLLGEAGPIEGH